jgi:hypothetical protein
METVLINSKPLLSKKRSLLTSTTLACNLPVLIDKLKHTYTWKNGGLNTMVLLKKPDKQIILTALHEGTQIDSFQSNSSITFKIIEGKIKFHSSKESVNLDKGQLLTFNEKANYRLTSKKDSVLLLTINNDTF